MSNKTVQNIGIDLGNTIVGNRTTGNKLEVEPGTFDILKKIVAAYDNVYIISRVNSEQRKRSLKWLNDVDFFNLTNIPESNLYYCFERKDKALFAKALNITTFIDDRIEVLAKMSYHKCTKILFNPPLEDLKLPFADEYLLSKIKFVKNWKEVDQYLNLSEKTYWIDEFNHELGKGLE